MKIIYISSEEYGFLWILQTEQKYHSVFAASSDYSDPAKRPKLVVTYQPMKKYFYLKDHLGNIRVTVDESGVVKGYNDYYPFGLRMRSMNNALATDMYKYSSKELDEEGLTGYTPFSVRVISKGYLDGNAAAVYVNDSYISGSGLYARGYTIVVVDENGTVVDKAHFDTYSSTAEADAMADFINNVATGHYVIGVIKDDGGQSMTENAYNALASVGCQHSREVGFRYSYAFIGKKGANNCGYEAYAPAGQGFVDKRIGESQSLAWYYFGARYFDPAIGRWLSVDPLADKYISYSPYNYVENNPTNLFDPDGKGWERDFNNFVSPNQTKHAAMHNSAIMLANERYYFNKYGPTVLDGMSVFFLLTGPAGAPFSAGTSFLSFFWSASLENHTTDTMVSLSTSVLGGMTKNPKIQLTLATLQIIYDLFLSGEDNFTNNTNMFTPDKTNVAHSLQHELMKDLGWLTKPSPQEMWDDINKDTENNNTTEEEDNNTD